MCVNDGADAKAASMSAEEQDQLIEDVRMALYASKICSYAQGMNLIRAKSVSKDWNLNLGELARIWKGGCIIRAKFLDRIRKAYSTDPDLYSLLFDKVLTLYVCMFFLSLSLSLFSIAPLSASIHAEASERFQCANRTLRRSWLQGTDPGEKSCRWLLARDLESRE